MTQRVIIAGATGLIGRALSARLAGSGFDVVGLSRNPQRSSGMPEGVRMEAWDGRTAKGWGELADGAHALINLAGETIAGRWSEERKRRILKSRLDATSAMIDAVRGAEVRPNVLIQGSAVGYYGPLGAEAVTEDAPPGDDFLARVCIEWEAASDAVVDLGVRRVIARTGVVLSQHGGALSQMVLPTRLFIGGPMAGGRQYVPWVHLEDEVGAIHFLLEDPTAMGAYNVTAPGSVTQADFARTAGRVLHRPAVVPTPGFALKLVLGQMSSLVLDGQNAVPSRLQSSGYEFRFPSLEAALNDLVG